MPRTTVDRDALTVLLATLTNAEDLLREVGDPDKLHVFCANELARYREELVKSMPENL